MTLLILVTSTPPTQDVASASNVSEFQTAHYEIEWDVDLEKQTVTPF